MNKLKGTAHLENSYAGILGKTIEPVIRPLGYDWKIGIALITSFAAREVFVGTMATLYSVGDDSEKIMRPSAKNERSNMARWHESLYTCRRIIPLIFYALAMQCMSTLAVVKRETHSWKWPAIMLIYDRACLCYELDYI